MTTLKVEQFEEFFHALHTHEPFPWQSLLLRRVVSGGWPDLIDLPTAHGKTACIDIGVFALALGALTPRRVWFVVDRRIVVDEAFERARRIAETLGRSNAGVLGRVASVLRSLGGSVPLQVDRLRGGAPRSIAWAGNPAQPAVITSTVDQIGSKLLFRGYGVSDAMKPVHAALAGNDSLVILDEAHLAQPFCQTVTAVQRFRVRPWATEPLEAQFRLVVMSATPPADEGARAWIKFPSGSERIKAIAHPKLDLRRAARKPTELAIARMPKATSEAPFPVGDELVMDAAERALKFATAGRQRIAVMVNRVRTAREIASVLQRLSLPDGAEVVLLTGRVRPVDRDRLIRVYEPSLKSGSTVQLASPVIVVTTQCLEVGADFSFDALVTECASLDALRQRFGRLARLGMPSDASGVILIRKRDIFPDDKLIEDKPADPIYGNALARTWNWMTVGGACAIDMGIDAIDPQLPADIAPYRGPQLDAPILLPAYLDLLSQTLPRPAVDPDVALFLHGVPPPGTRPLPQVRVLWREELREAANTSEATWAELVAGLPPLTGEMLPMPLWECRKLLAGQQDAGHDDADLEGGFEPEEKEKKSPGTPSRAQPFVIWRSRDSCFVSDAASSIRPDDVIVLPAVSGLPGFKEVVPYAWATPDVYELAFRSAHQVIRRRWRPSSSDGDDFDPSEVVASLTGAMPPEEQSLFRDPHFVQYAEGFFHFTGRTKKRPVDEWDSDSDEDDRLYEGSDGGSPQGARTNRDSRSLSGHTKDVVAAAAHLANVLPEPFRDVLRKAADLHDFGKADPRFQYLLNHGRRVDPSRLRAKSDFRLSPAQESQLRRQIKLPEGFRHELLSMQIAFADPRHTADPRRDLLLHLIASHHGRCRPFAPVVVDDEPVEVTVDGCTLKAAERNAVPPHSLASDVAERFWSLTRRYGWWGLAYLESILRCADMHASAYHDQEGRR